MNIKRQLRLIAATAGTVAATLGLLAPGLASAANQPNIYVPENRMSAASGVQFSVPVRIDPAGNELDTVNVKVAFPADQLSFAGLDKSGSAFDTFVPSVPTAQDGKVEFAAAHLTNPVTDDSLVVNMLFTAKVSAGSAAISLEGSATARKGADIPATSSGTTIVLSQGGSASAVKMTDVQATDIRVNGGTIRWKTDVPATSSVDYGSTTHYGLTAGSLDLVTDHVVKLDSVFGGGVTVHFALTSRDGSGNVGVTSDKTFRTTGYTVSITVTDKKGKALSGAEVRVGSLAAVKADANGVAVVGNVDPGNQKVVVNGGEAQYIAVRAVNGTKAVAVQKFDLQAKPQQTWIRVLGVLVVAVLAAILVTWLWRERAKKQAPKV